MLSWSLLFAQNENENLQRAKEFSWAGQYAHADSIFSELASKNVNDINVKMAKAFNFSWWGNFQKANELFKEIIKLDPKNIDAHIGLGNSYTYNQEYANAYYEFNKVLSIDPNNHEAKKGLAYKYFYEGNYVSAEKYFNQLLKAYPHIEEYSLSLAKVYLAQNKVDDGNRLLAAVMNKNPTSSQASNIQGTARNTLSDFEINTWASTTLIENSTKFGLRMFSINAKLKNKHQLGLRIDNSLATDNLSYFKNNLFAPIIWINTGLQLTRSAFLNIDLGNRFYNGSTPMFKMDFVYFAKYNLVVKSGLFTDVSPKTTEYNLRFGLEKPVLKNLRFGGTYFFAKESINSKNVNRWLITSKIEFNKGASIDLGYFFGDNGITNIEYQQSMVNGFFMIGQIPVSKTFSILCLANKEYGVFNDTAVIALGLRTKFYTKK